MGEDYSSAGPDYGQFDKTCWSMVLEAVQSESGRIQGVTTPNVKNRTLTLSTLS